MLDVILDTDESVFGKRSLVDPYNTLKFASIDPQQHQSDRKLSNDTIGGIDPVINTNSSILHHPDCLSFVPIALDDRRHIEKMETSSNKL